MTVRVLTGITPSGTPHIGNYVGMYRQAIRASSQPGVESFFFLADLHGLIKSHDPALLQRATLEQTATWLACGLDPQRSMLYRQSDIPEIVELNWLLTAVTGKGMLNRAHAYKAAVDRNTAAGQDPDVDVSAGLYMYPVLMTADILAFSAHRVPVGRDQVQHVEMARDIALRFNHLYGEGLLTPPEATIEAEVATLPGLDGRKMSKSYGNTIALFAQPTTVKKQIAGIITDSRAPGEAKDPEGSAVFQLYQAFASADETAAFRQAYADGIAWGDAKLQLAARIEQEVAPLRARYDALMADPQQVEDILQAGAGRARAVAAPLLARLRDAVGLRSLGQLSPKAAAKAARAAVPAFKQYREADGRFHFKLVDAQGRTLLVSEGFADPKACAAEIAMLRAGGDQERVRLAEGVEPADVVAALSALAAAA